MSEIKIFVNGRPIKWPPDSWPGGMDPVWKLNKRFLKKFIKEENLKPAKFEIVIDDADPFPIKPWHLEGMPAEPHFHLNKKVYLVNDEQYKRFACGLAAGFRTKLENPADIPFQDIAKAAIEDSIIRQIKK